MKGVCGRMLLSAVVASLSAAGCGGGADGPEEYPVHGLVTFDAAPVESGRIVFRQVEGEKRAFSGEIAGGEYTVNAQPGKMTVEITASRIIPGKFDNSNGTPEPVGEMYIPTVYNSETTLTADVGSDDNEIPFELKSVQ